MLSQTDVRESEHYINPSHLYGMCTLLSVSREQSASRSQTHTQINSQVCAPRPAARAVCVTLMTQRAARCAAPCARARARHIAAYRLIMKKSLLRGGEALHLRRHGVREAIEAALRHLARGVL